MTDFIESLAYALHKELSHFVCDKSFDKACTELKGFNKTEDFFDCNYKDICTTIFRTQFGGCIVSDVVEVWSDDDIARRIKIDLL